MNKKGVENYILYLAFMGIFALIVTMAIFKGVGSASDGTFFWKVFYARDPAMLIDIGQAGRGDLEINYNLVQATRPLVFELKENSVQVFEYSDFIDNPRPTSFRFATGPNVIIENKELFTSYFKIYLSASSVKISEEALKTQTCANFNTSEKPEDITIYVESNDLFIATLVESGLSREGFTIADKAKDANLGILIENSDRESLAFYYKKNLRKSERLTCLITNEIVESSSEELFVTNIERIDGNSAQFTKLLGAEDGLVVEAKLNDDIGKSIAKGVITFYG